MLSKLIGENETGEIACRFSCGSQLGIGPVPGNFFIYGRIADPVYPSEARLDYLLPTEPFQYSVNQYRCADLKALKHKLLQFPAGSTFSIAHTGSGFDAGDWPAIRSFLQSKGYLVQN